MIPTRAAGLVIFRNINQSVQFLMLQTSNGQHHWTPPKGHVEPGESEWITAFRETNEEAGLSKADLEVYENIASELHYFVKGNPKVVVYWLAKLINPNTVVTLSDEHQDFKWLSLKEAQGLYGNDNMSKLLAKFHDEAKTKTLIV